ncbi:MAG: MlaD family protein [Solirubrobacteraceae bacterium]
MAFGRNKKTSDDPAGRVPRKDRMGASPLKVGAIVLAVLIALTYLGFTKHIPFTHDFRVKAVFTSAIEIRKNSPVRIAGVNVGKVVSVDPKPGTDYSVVTMEVNKDGLPIHKDATMKIRPRIFLEGNFFVDIQPGTPDAPNIGDGDTIPVTQTAAPVQFDQVLSALTSDTRSSLQKLLGGLGTGLTYKPSAAQDTGADPSARGQSAAESLNDSLRYGKRALRGTAIVTDAFLGTQPHDLSRLIAGLSRVTEGLGRNEAQLKDLVTNFNTTVAATASEATNLQASIRLLAPTLQTTNRALDSLNAAFPNTRAFAHDILPGVRETAATIDASFPWIAQTRKLLGPTELQGVARELSPTTRDLAAVIDASVQLLPQVNLAAKCATHNILPTGDIKIQDGPLTNGTENYKEFWYTMVGLAGEGQNFDGNGMYVRFQPGGGDQMVAMGAGQGANAGQVFGNAVAKPLGTRPAYPGKRPPYRPDVPCYTQAVPDLNGAASGPADGTEASGRAAGAAVARAAGRSGARAGGLRLRGLRPASARTTAKSKGLLGALDPFGKGTR